ncbi:related to heat shock factor protein 4 [Lichtheimia corymbifera JMRC:FSU:9682]|uniref:Related to heat shock factor protein 4 n=1 Tax=Lichtheimia corymbifera JMRC:FSU:9682 TaxID=1263082 RepID=A0A068RM14_9FUNG|nr:related to heat shock factor protein 4 [Lichtheimia corymbifera JMRC:FSU:9682]
MISSPSNAFDSCNDYLTDTRQQHPRSQDFLQPPSTAKDGRQSSRRANGSRTSRVDNTFVHKLYSLVNDPRYQHLIEWDCSGQSFLVRNVMEFSREVLPKHFKHSNFSSFIRQLNMYGFCKVNKSPRGHRSLVDERQVWEFSHSSFIRGRPELVDSIRRKTLDHNESKNAENQSHHHGNKRGTSLNNGGNNNNPAQNARMAMLQVNHSNISQQIVQLQANCNQVMQELAETRRRQDVHQRLMKDMMHFLMSQGANNSSQQQQPQQESNNYMDDVQQQQQLPPPIYITTPPESVYPPPPSSLQENNAPISTTGSLTMCIDSSPQQQHMPATPPFFAQESHHVVSAMPAYHALSTPSSPGPATPFTDDEAASVCSFQSPHTPNSAIAAFNTPDTFI